MQLIDGIPVKEIPTFPGYAISKKGQVISLERIDRRGHKRRKHWLKYYYWNTNKYVGVSLHKDNKYYLVQVHKLVLETYVGLCPKGQQCRHLDGNPKNNNLSNLRWGTPRENQLDRKRHGTDCKGESHGKTSLMEEDIRIIFHAYHDGIASQRELAKKFNVCQSTVKNITKKRTWSHIWD